MARLPAMVDALAAIDDRPRGALDFIARAVREAGFIQTTKRGRGAAGMTAADAAAFLLGCYGSREATSAAEAVAALSALQRVPDDSRLELMPDWSHGLVRAQDAIAALAALIEMAPLIEQQGRRMSATVFLHRPTLKVRIEVRHRVEKAGGVRIYELEFGPSADEAALGYDVQTRIGLKTFLTLHFCLFPPDEAARPPWAGRPGKSVASPRR